MSRKIDTVVKMYHRGVINYATAYNNIVDMLNVAVNNGEIPHVEAEKIWEFVTRNI